MDRGRSRPALVLAVKRCGHFYPKMSCSTPTAAASASPRSSPCTVRTRWSATLVRSAIVSGFAGLVLREQDGSIDTVAFEHRDGRIINVNVTRNPDKLHHVTF